MTKSHDQKQLTGGESLIGLHFQVTIVIEIQEELKQKREAMDADCCLTQLRFSLSQLSHIVQGRLPEDGIGGALLCQLIGALLCQLAINTIPYRCAHRQTLN